MKSVDSNKVAQITFAFWVMKICATTLGETAGDLVSMTLHLGYAFSTILWLLLFILCLVWQLESKRFHPVLYWSVILATSTAGTTMSDFMDRTLRLGYLNGSLLLVAGLIMMLISWYLVEGSLQVNQINSKRTEIFYWATILVSNTLGTALGDFLADDSGLGFMGAASLIASVIILIAMLYQYSKVNRILLFWCAFVLTRPFGATFGDLLTKPLSLGGFGFGTTGTSTFLAALLVASLIRTYYLNQTQSRK